MHHVQENADAGAVGRGIATAAIVLVIDLVSKQNWFPNADDVSAFSFFGGWIRNVRHLNFGLLADLPVPQPLIWFVSVVIIGFTLYGLLRAARERQTRQIYALGILLGGAIGNLCDRVSLGFVRDWILLGGRSALNVADIAILIGILGWILTERKNIHTKTD